MKNNITERFDRPNGQDQFIQKLMNMLGEVGRLESYVKSYWSNVSPELRSSFFNSMSSIKLSLSQLRTIVAALQSQTPTQTGTTHPTTGEVYPYDSNMVLSFATKLESYYTKAKDELNVMLQSGSMKLKDNVLVAFGEFNDTMDMGIIGLKKSGEMINAILINTK
jgi:hypothetical protein